MTTRKYSSRSQSTTLASAITSASNTITVISASSVLGGITIAAGETFTIVIDPDTALEEIVDIYSASGNPVSGNTLSIVRNIDGSVAQSHSAGAEVRHMAIGRDYREANTHIENVTTAHGLTIANVLETTDTNMITTAMLQSNSVTTAKITDANVTAAKIAADAVTTDKIAADAVSTIKIADGAITSAKILNGTIATEDIADSAITTAKIAAGAVATVDIADLAVTTGKIADSAITSAKIADGTIVAEDIADGAITSAKILDGTIVAGDIADGAITTGKILNGTITNDDVNTSAQIAYGKLNLNNTIHNDDVRADANIASTKIAGTAVTLADTGTVTSAMIANGTVVNADISDTAAIALSKLASDPLARANHTGTQTASTISNFDTQVRTSKVTDLAAPTGSFSMNSQKITSLATPTTGTDAATKAYADLMVPLSQKGVANGVAELDADGLVPAHYLPALSITTTQVVSSQAAMLALTAQTGDVAVRTDVNKTFILTTTPATTLGNWQELLTPTDSVISVDGQTGAVSLSSTYATVANAANKLPLAGGTMSGAIAMGSNKITGLGTPTSTGDAATKDYADTKLSLTGGTLSGQINMGANKITNLADPTNLTDAMTLNYFNDAALAPSNLTGPITSIGPATSIASQTGTGTKFVMEQSPTLVTPNIGVATATSINSTVIPSSKTLVATDSTDYVVPSQTGNSGKYLTTNGTTSSWGTVNQYSAPTIGSTSIASGATVTTIAGLTLTAPIVTLSVNTQTGTSYTPVASDAASIITLNNGSAISVTIPTDASVPYAIGTQLNFVWITGAGQPTISAATPGTTTILSTGATSTGPKLRAVNAVATAIKLATDSWLVTGDIA